MSKYHTKGDGNVAVCTAYERACPLGEEETHFYADTELEANQINSERLKVQYENSLKSIRKEEQLSTVNKLLEEFNTNRNFVYEGMTFTKDKDDDYDNFMTAELPESLTESTLTVYIFRNPPVARCIIKSPYKESVIVDLDDFKRFETENEELISASVDLVEKIKETNQEVFKKDVDLEEIFNEIKEKSGSYFLHIPGVKDLTQASGAAPEIWEGKLDDGRDFYIRIRWGHARAAVYNNDTQEYEIVYDQSYSDNFKSMFSKEELYNFAAHTAKAIKTEKVR